MRWIFAFGVLIFYSSHSVAESHKDWEFSVENGEATIIGNTGTNSELTIPEKIDKIPVTSIGTNAFMNNVKLTNVVIGKAVTNISSGAFSMCYELKNVETGPKLVSIGAGAFAHCFKLTNVSNLDGVTNIGKNAFEGSVSSLSKENAEKIYHLVYGPIFKYYENRPEKYLNKKVNVFIQGIRVPALNENENCDFRIYKALEGKLQVRMDSFILIKVPRAKTDAFLSRYRVFTNSNPSMSYPDPAWETFGLFKMADKMDSKISPLLKGNYFLEIPEE